MAKITEVRTKPDGTLQMYISFGDREISMPLNDWIELTGEIIEEAIVHEPQMYSCSDDSMQIAAQAGYDLSTWAASINWSGGRNTSEWLSELREKIERCQTTACEAGIEKYGMPAT